MDTTGEGAPAVKASLIRIAPPAKRGPLRSLHPLLGPCQPSRHLKLQSRCQPRTCQLSGSPCVSIDALRLLMAGSVVLALTAVIVFYRRDWL